MNPQEDLIAFVYEGLGIPSSQRLELIPFPGRGSEREYYRILWEGNSVIAVRYQSNRIENSYFVDIALFLARNGIPVPQILHHDPGRGYILLEDLGDTDLWLLRDSPWPQRKALYQTTLEAANRLHRIPEHKIISDGIRLMEPFSPDLYRWERDYFTANFVATLCDIHLTERQRQCLECELQNVVTRLLSQNQCLVHRDLQSQNVLIHRGSPYLIDFQGMRFGSRFYDLGSLLCDPYVHFTDTERMELLAYYHGMSEDETEWEVFLDAFWNASVQRLLQALGAYSFLGLKKGLRGYLAHVMNALKNLQQAARAARTFPTLLDLCAECENVLPKILRASPGMHEKRPPSTLS